MSDAGRGAQKLHEALTRLQKGEAEEAQAAAAAALEAFSAAADRTGTAASHQLLALLAVNAGEIETALSHIDAAIPLRESTGDNEGLAALLQERFELCLRTGDFAGAQAAMRQQAEVHGRTGDREGQAHAMHQLAQMLLQEGNDTDAEELVQQACFLNSAPGQERALSALQLLYSNIWIHRQNYARAMAHAKQGIDLARQAKFKPAEVDAQQQIGIVFALLGDHRSARRALEDALVGRELLKDTDGRAQLLQELANVELAMGDVESGLDRLDYAARTMRETHNIFGELTFLQIIQAAADEHPSPTTAERALQAARRMVVLTDGLGQPEASAAAAFALASRLAGTGDLDGATDWFRKALAIQAAHGLEHEQAVSQGMLGQILVARGEREEGLALLQQSLTALDALGSEAAPSIREILTELTAE